MKTKTLSLICLLLLPLALNAARVDTLMVKSPSMNKEVQVLVVVPDVVLEKPVHCPVIYLLHGYSGNALSWINLKPDLPEIVDEKGIMIVCPDGQNSWYWDSPLNPDSRYETFVSQELINYIDTNYPTIPRREARAITGLSMGGHGGMWLSMRHKDVFGAGGSMSGGLDIRPFPKNWLMAKQLGEYSTNKQAWEEHTAIHLIEGLKDGELAIIIDCGVDDFFYPVNLEFHQCLLEKKIAHDFISRPGNHDRKYWNNAIDFQILYFYKFFSK